MTIDETIEHAKEVARTCDDSQRAAEHVQLAEWLRQARGADKAAKWYTAKIRGLEAENAKLRELARGMYGILATFDAILGNHDACETPRPLIFGENKSFKDVMRELGVEVEE